MNYFWGVAVWWCHPIALPRVPDTRRCHGWHMTPVAVTQPVVAQSPWLDKDGRREQIAQLWLWPNPAQIQAQPREERAHMGTG